MKQEKDLKGLGGWLILVGIGIVISPFKLGAEYLPLFYSIFTDGTYEYLTNPNSDVYHPMWGPLLIGEVVYNSLLIVAYSGLVYLFFSKHYLFPKVFITLSLIVLVMIPFDAWLSSFVLVDEPIFDPATAKEFARAVIGVVIWVPYMLISKRVKQTFVEKQPKQQQPVDEMLAK